MSNKPVQTPIRVKDKVYSFGTYKDYTYACNGCGKEVGGYNHSKVYGHVWCRECERKLTKARFEKQKNYIRIDTIEDCIEAIADKYSIYDDTVFGIIRLLREMEQSDE